MNLSAGFSEVDISPPLGTRKIGWIKELVIDHVADPILARIATLRTGSGEIAFIDLDLLAVEADDVREIRRRIQEAHGFPGDAIMVSATHNHAGPATASLGDVRRDEGYVEEMIGKIVRAFGDALANGREAFVGVASTQEWHLSHNRRMVMRDGTVRTHTGYGDPDALYVEGPIDPEVSVLAAKSAEGDLLGAVVNFACHPTHHGSDGALSAGYPGVLANAMKAKGCPVTLFLNGAAGNISLGDILSGAAETMEDTGRSLAEAASRAMESIRWRERAELGCRMATVALPYREPTEEQVRGTAVGAQRFVDSAAYDRDIPGLVERIRKEGAKAAEIQALFLDEFAYLSVPAELFVQLGLRIKEESHPRRALVTAYANGYVGYVPHREAFRRGGYETTFCSWSCLAPEVGDMIADRAIEVIRMGPEAERN
jgi:hypothetical protein